MKRMTSVEIRNMWIKYFTEHEHLLLPSASLIPEDDDSLLWINAGMTPLKKYFDGRSKPEKNRLVSIQKCIRTNDIENVGVTKRHQTFFEMMGNFSIGDYFKKEAILFSMELLTGEEWFAIPKEKLYVTIYPQDDEAYETWVSVGMDPSHIIKLEGNYWEIGEGPSGPDSEIFYDRGEEYDKDGTAFQCLINDEDNERYLEIWNNVFSQYNAKEGVKREDYKELPHKNIDTGAGLERWACIFQGVDSNFDTDLFQPILQRVEEMTGISYQGQMAFKVIADHIRALTFALADGAVFGNGGRGYVLRRLLRRSVRFGKKLGLEDPFMYRLVEQVVSIMKESYPYLLEKQGIIQTLIYEEEMLFHTTLAAGERRLYELMDESVDQTISGYDAFKLYDTYGFPFELTLEYLEERHFTVDKEEFDRYMDEAKKLAKRNHKQEHSMSVQREELLNFDKKSEFLYQCYELKSSVIGLLDGDTFVDSLDHDGVVILKKTCFYAEAGGQVSDTGIIKGKGFEAEVVHVEKAPNGQHLHFVKLLKGKIKFKDDCTLCLDSERRKRIEANHSTAHLLQYYLRQVVSSHIEQAGSKVSEDSVRFDFTYHGKIPEQLLFEVEHKINQVIQEEIPTSFEVMSLEDAKKTGAMALFQDKYGEEVRVVKIGDSLELCGGTHVKNTKDIERFAICSFESKGSNVYRIEGVTKDRVLPRLFEEIKPYNDAMSKLLLKARDILNEAKSLGISLSFDVDINHDAPTSYQDILFNRNELEYVSTEVRNLEKVFFEKKQQQALSDLSYFQEKEEFLPGGHLLVMDVHDYEMEVLKTIMDQLLNQMGKGFIFIANVHDDHVNFLARSNTALHAGLLVKSASVRSMANGGGSATFAQGGGKTTEHLKTILEEVRIEAEKVLGK